MTEKNKGGVEETKAPMIDAFGSPIPQEGDTKPVESGTKETDDKGGEKKGEKSAEVIALETKLEEYSKNLTGQGSVIDQLKQKIAVLEAGGGKKDDNKGGEGNNSEVLFADIKYSKDLSEEERDDMTETEIALFDANAKQQEAMNKMFATIQAGNTQQEGTKVDNLNQSAQQEALALAENDKELADKILLEFKEFNNEGITEEKLKERMKKALNNVEDYTPPKESISNSDKGKPVGGKGGNDSDPFGNQAIVDSVYKKSDGSYSL